MYQVPLPFVIVLDDTWYTKGIHVMVCFSQPGDGYEKRFCLVQTFYRQDIIQPNIAVVFWETGRGIRDFDKQAYEDDVLLLWSYSSYKIT